MTNSEEPSAPTSSNISSGATKFGDSGGEGNNGFAKHSVVLSSLGIGEEEREGSSSSSSSTGVGKDYPSEGLGDNPLGGPLPFSPILGEWTELKSALPQLTVVLTNYRLYITQTAPKNSTHNLPLGLLESVELRDIFYLIINCKDARSIKCTFPNNEAALEMLKRIQGAINTSTSPLKQQPLSTSSGGREDNNFAFIFYKATEGGAGDDVKAHLGLELPPFPSAKERFDAEVKRMEFNVKGPWRVSDENKEYELCSSYPTHIIVPCVMDKKKLEQVAQFRSARRFPAVVWRHKGNGAVISRCSQPEVGWFGWRSNEDEELVQNIVLACADNSGSNSSSSSSTTIGGLEERRRINSGCSVQSSSDNSTRRRTISSSSNISLSEVTFDNSGGESDGGLANCHFVSSQPNSPAPYNSLNSIELVPEPPNIKKLLILDARSYSTAVVNRARGGGCECLEYYTNCEIQFMNLANIHSIRKSFINVRQLCSLPADQANNNWFSQLESCKWLQHMSGLMKAAVTVATTIEYEGRPVMVHCSDGWDRTPQIVALAEILLDPYYRSLEGFQVLVEREWLDFGHKFADRCGQGVGSDDTNERCPVFLQWLDCLHQLIKQFPTAFEFNLTFLVKLAQHTYSNLFGTFLCNTSKERESLKLHQLTHSIWRFLRAPANYSKFRNHLYANCDQVLWPCCEVRELKLWTQVYLGFDNPVPVLTEVINPSQESSPAPSVAAECDNSERISAYKLEQSKRSSSCENLHSHHAGQLQRRNSDPSLSDSVLGMGPEPEDSRCCPAQTEKLLTAASRDIKTATETETCTTTLKATTPNTNTAINSKEGERDFIVGEEEDDDEEEKNPSEPELVINNLKFLKSIESSTDTLVADPPAEFSSNPNFYGEGIQKFVMEVSNDKTDKYGQDAQILSTKTEEMFGLEKSCDIGSGTEGSGINLNLSSSSTIDQSQVEIDQIIIGSNPSNQHCEVCATSRKLLLDEVTPTLTLTSSSPNSGNSSSSMNSSSNNSNSNSTTTIINNASTNNQQIINNLPSTNGNKISSTTLTTSSSGGSNPSTSTTNNSLQSQQDDSSTGAIKGQEQSPTSGKKSFYDVDGLEPLHDEVQSRLNVIISSYRGKIDNLQKELQMYRDALMKQVCHKCTHQGLEKADDAVSVADSLCSGEQQSVGHESYSSEKSWEAVDERDTRPPLWLPDFAVQKCMGCEATFWLGKRKHHCRSCGKIFCADCSENTITIPSEQIFTPVRVCYTCFNHLSMTNHQSNGVMLMPNGINSSPVMNGNGYMHQNGGGGGNHLVYNPNHRGSSPDPQNLQTTPPRQHLRRMSEELPRKHHPKWNTKQTVGNSPENGGILKVPHPPNYAGAVKGSTTLQFTPPETKNIKFNNSSTTNGHHSSSISYQ